MTNNKTPTWLLFSSALFFGSFFGGIVWKVAQQLWPGGNRMWIGGIVLLVFLSGAVIKYRE
ncbi:MAG: hypothetical protein KBC26_01425 [Candidatus Pacebacteria bacterium]|nr:hypothetical protein [Candidatus Paceibacterota bacterium]